VSWLGDDSLVGTFLIRIKILKQLWTKEQEQTNQLKIITRRLNWLEIENKNNEPNELMKQQH